MRVSSSPTKKHRSFANCQSAPRYAKEWEARGHAHRARPMRPLAPPTSPVPADGSAAPARPRTTRFSAIATPLPTSPPTDDDDDDDDEDEDEDDQDCEVDEDEDDTT
ncbi:hypothetical protein KM043_009855 [Ampulex compressa]|nr:hypothetical protein KM043_009855 [Ampulex compressa]